MRIILDCNVVISAGLTADGICQRVLKNAFEHHTIIVTNEIYQNIGSLRQEKNFRHLKKL